MRCPRCQTENREGRHFCAECGAPFAGACPACGFSNEPAEKFCGGCGSSLVHPTARAPQSKPPSPAIDAAPRRAAEVLTARSALAVERRQLTVMFCDLVGSTELSQRLDPEDLREIYRLYQDACKTAIEHVGGYVAQYLGDGVLAYFGYPKAHEDDAERAVRAGLAVIAAMDAVNAHSSQATSVALAVRVGIATGPVVVGDLIGEGAFQERAVVGETPNLAARLQGLAPRNAIVIAPGTKRLVRGVFHYRDLGEHALKGFAEPVHVWQVTGECEAESRFAAIRGMQLTPLIGRDAELGLLFSRWQRATDGDGQVVLLSGEPGIGKSRLSAALLERVAGTPHTHLRYSCSPHHTDSALHPVITQLERAAGLLRDDLPGMKLDKLEALLGPDRGRTAEVAPWLAALLSIPGEDRYPRPTLTPQAQKARTFDALIARLEGLAARQPVLMVLEDAHWLDPTTTELFGLMIARLPRLSVLFLVTHRPEFTTPWTGLAAPVTSLTLTRLGRRHGEEIIGRITGGKPLPAEVLEQILVKTDGVPLFVEEFTKAILESGFLRDAGDRYELVAPLPAQVIPATLHDSLMYRLDRQPSVKEVALAGAVIGRTFSFELVAAVTALSRDALERALTHLVDSELASRQGHPPEATYTFKHALVRDAAYQSLLKSTRRQLHARVAEVLVAQFPESADAEPERIAQHFTAADLAEPAIPHWLAAGQRALSRSSLPEAVSHLSKALDLTAHIGNESDRAERELEVRTALGAATMALHGWPAPAVRDVVKPACDLVERGHGGADAFMNLWNLWVHHGCRAEHRDGLAVVDRMLKHANRRRDPVLALVSSFTAAMANLWIGNYDVAAIHEQAALEMYQDERDQRLVWSYNHDPRNTLLSWASHRVWALGYPDQARALSDEAVAHARRLGHPFNLCWTLGNSSMTFAQCGDHARVRSRLGELRRVAGEQELVFMDSYMVPVVACVVAAREREPEAVYDEGARAEAAWRAIGGRFYSPIVRAYMAQACGDLGRTAEAITLVNAAIEQMESTGEWMCAEEVYRVAGLVHLDHARSRTVAESFFQKSLESSRTHGTKSFGLRTSMGLARLWREDGRRRDAHDLLARAYECFSEGFDTADVKAAKALLDELS